MTGYVVTLRETKGLYIAYYYSSLCNGALDYLNMVASPEAEKSSLPVHIAIIMDGNGRWALNRGLPRFEGHKAGVENIRRAVKCFGQHGIKYVTLYAFSTENWRRSKQEVRGLFGLLGRVIDKETQNFHKEGIKLNLLGNLEGLNPILQKKVRNALELTKDNKEMTLCIAFNYGGRDEILRAVTEIIKQGLMPEEITEEVFSRHLYTTGLPDPDLIIRTGGELRLSNFLLWQSAYSEYYSTLTYWPDFGEEEINKALAVYRQRQRRFGGLG